VGLRRIAPYRESEWVLPPKKRKKDLVVLREKIKDEVDKLGLNKPNVIGGGRGEQEEEEEQKIMEGDEEMAIEPQVNGEDDNEVIMMDEAERKRQKRKRRQMKKIQAATKIEEEEKGEGDNVGAIDSTDKINNPSVNMNKKKKKAKTDSMTSKPISTTGISQSRKASYGL
jgi:hypothetical protein